MKIIQQSPLQTTLSNVTSILAIAAGKGGVGKSTIAVNLALSLKKKGFEVGLLDADVYGPSLEQMLPEGMEPTEDLQNPEKLLPGLTLGIPFISVAHFKKKASIIRAPIANQIIDQFLHLVDWGNLDYLIIDFPPGTGDIPLTLMQKAPIDGALVVTTPQIVSTIDVSKAIQLFQQMQIPLLGVVENMSYFFDPETKEKKYLFGKEGAKNLCKQFSLPLLGEIPIDPYVSQTGDEGKSLLEIEENSLGKEAFFSLSNELIEQMKKIKREIFACKQENPDSIQIKISEKWYSISVYEIQKRCPCARCEIKKNSHQNVSLLEFSPVGRYALKLKFTKGCSQGIYPFSLLKQLAIR